MPRILIPKEVYSYATMPLAIVEPMLRVPIPKDSYLADEANTRALKDLFNSGYKWIRTDGEFCVFERKERG